MTDPEALTAVDVPPARLLDDLDAGFVELVRSHERVVYSVALRVTGHRFDAEDLAAEAFLRAYRALRGYDRERLAALRPRAWLLTILLNTWRNALRDAGRRPRQVGMPESLDPAASGASIEELVEGDETLRELGALLVRLPPAQRAAVVLRHVVGLPMTEVAEALGCPEGTAKSHVSRGLARLRSAYAPAPAGVVQPFPPSPRRAGAGRRVHPAAASVTDVVPRIAARRRSP